MSRENSLHHGAQLNAITSLRFFAALHVVLYHLYSNGYLVFYFPNAKYNEPSSVKRILLGCIENGYVSVSLFFVLSGFILVHAYQGRKLETREQRVGFYIARLSRIYPVYIFSLISIAPLILSLVLSGQKSVTNTGIGLLLNMALVQSWFAPAALSWNAPGWSLSVECLFYLLFPLLYSAIPHWSKIKLTCTAFMAYLLGLTIPLIYLISSPDGIGPSEWPHSYFDRAPLLAVLNFLPIFHLHEFIIGIIAGVFYTRWNNTSLSRIWTFISAALFLVILCALGNTSDAMYPLLHAGLMAPVFAILIYALANTNLNTRIEQNSVLETLGRASFSLYLLHGPILLSWKYFYPSTTGLPPSMGTALSILATSVAVSVIVFRYIEEPMRKFSQAFLTKILLHSRLAPGVT